MFEETALLLVTAKVPQATPEQTQADYRKTQDFFASHGITTIQEGGASPQDVADLRAFADTGDLHLDIVAYVQHTLAPELAADFAASRAYDNHLRVGGIKLTLDGSPQGKTAWLTQPYLVPPLGLPRDYRGYGTLETLSSTSLSAQLSRATSRSSCTPMATRQSIR